MDVPCIVGIVAMVYVVVNVRLLVLRLRVLPLAAARIARLYSCTTLLIRLLVAPVLRAIVLLPPSRILLAILWIVLPAQVGSVIRGSDRAHDACAAAAAAGEQVQLT